MGLFKPNIEKLEAKQDAEALVRLLGHKDGDYRSRSAEALTRLGASAVGPLIRTLPTEDEKLRELVGGTLGSIGEPAVDPLVEALADEKSRPQAVSTLKRIGEPAVGALVQTLQDESTEPTVRAGTALALGEIGDHRARGPLLHALKDKHSDIRKQAAGALDLMQWTPEDDSTRFAYLIAKGNWRELSECGESAVEPLVQSLKHYDDWETRTHIIWALGMSGQRKAIEPLLEMLAATRFIVRIEAAKALMRIGEPLSMEIAARNLITLFNIENNDSSIMVSMTLTEMGEPAVEPLLEAVEDVSAGRRVRWFAAMTLGNIGDARAVEPLIRALKDGDSELGASARGSLEKLDKLDEAKERYREAVRSNPDLAEAHYHLGNVHRHSKEAGEAIEEYREAIRLDPDHANAHKVLGDLLRESHDLRGAASEYAEAISIVPGNAEWRTFLGFVLMSLGKFSEAETELREAIRLDPGLAEAHGTLGGLLGGLHRATEARRELKTAIELSNAAGNSHNVKLYSDLLHEM